MDAYFYNADIYCEDCGARACADIKTCHPEFEGSSDSNEYPQGPCVEGGGEADSFQHCGNGDQCINGIDIGDGIKVGMFLDNELTCDGVIYSCELLYEYTGGKGGSNVILDIWADSLSDYCLCDGDQEMLDEYFRFRDNERNQVQVRCHAVFEADWEKAARRKTDNKLRQLFGG